jgi:predicted transposase YdaD
LRGKHQFDVAIKEILHGAVETLRQIGVRGIRRWLNVELPHLRAPCVDLLGETESGELIQVELQTTNDPSMPLRMLEYGVAIARRHGRFPRQIVVYVGRDRLRMVSDYAAADVVFRYELLDFRSLNAGAMLKSRAAADHILALLADSQTEAAIHRILKRIERLPEAQRKAAANSLLVISGLRGLETTVRREVETMPIIVNLLDHAVYGPYLREAMKKGRERGLKNGREEGREQGRDEAARRLAGDRSKSASVKFPAGPKNGSMLCRFPRSKT